MFGTGKDGGASDRDRLSAKLLLGVSAAALCTLGLAQAPAAAQDAAVENDEVIVVRGIRSSLRSSQDIKRNADVFVDSITAEDIGALPDRSVTEALQRVPGVAISRFAAGVDPDHFSVEGSGVVIRGLNFVRSELNGRDTFTANNGRALSFADVTPELMGGVDVFKSPSADMIEGGISGTVNLRTRVPFDSAGRLIAGSIEGSYGDFAEEWAPTASVLYSDRWEMEDGSEFGLLLNFVNSQLLSRADGTQASNFFCRTTLGAGPADCNGTPGVWFPRGAAFRSQTFDRERIGYALAAQWESPDDTMLATFQFMRSDSSQAWTEHAVEIATDVVRDQGDSSPMQGTTFEFDDNGIFTSGIITAGNTGWRDDQNRDPTDNAGRRTSNVGLQSNNIRRDVDQRYITTDYGFNFKWTPNSQWAFNLDYQHVESTVENLDATIWGSTHQSLDLTLRGEDAPVFTFLPPSLDGTVPVCDPPTGACPTYYRPPHDSFSDPYNSYWRAAMDHAEDSEGEEDALRLDVDYRFSQDGFFRSVRAGVRWAERDQTTRFTQYNWAALSEIWGGGGPVWFDEDINGDPATPGGTPSSTETYLWDFDNFFRGEVPVPTGSQPVPFYAHNITENYDAYAAFAMGIGDEWRARIGADACFNPNSPLGPNAPQNWVPLHLRCDVLADSPGGRYRPQEINPINEVTNAAYVMLTFGQDLDNGSVLSGNVGLRFVETRRSSSGYLAFPRASFSSDADCTTSENNYLAGDDGIPGNADDRPDLTGFDPSPFCGLDLNVRQAARDWANGAIIPNTTNVSFSHVLPSLNVRWEATDDLQFRFGWSKAISYPDIGLVRNYYNLALDANNQEVINANGGIPTGNVTVGNPSLEPIESTNYDLSGEWYFADVGSLTLSLFYKELDGVITNSSARLPFTNNGQTFDVAVTVPGNSTDTGTVKGFEIAYQQFYDFLPAPFDGFGINANYTYIDSSGVPQSTLSSTDPDVAAGRVANIDTSLLPLQGLSEHNFNIAGIYEKGPVSARLAYNWRSEFLLTVRDVIVPFAPIMNEDTGQLDGSFFYTINENWKIGVQGVNLTNEITRTSQVLNDDLLRTGRSWFMNDRRFTVVARATF